VILGAHNLSDPYELDRITKSLSEIRIHEDWNSTGSSFDADIAILTLDKEIQLNKFVKPINVWKETVLMIPVEGSVFGWGMIRTMTTPRSVKLQIQSNEDCFLNDYRLASISSRRTFCAGSSEGSNICQGDGGSGLFVMHQNTLFLKGIVSSAFSTSSDCVTGKNIVFTDVPKYGKWIADNTVTTLEANTKESINQENEELAQIPYDAYLYGLNRVDDNEGCSKYSGFAPCWYQKTTERDRRCNKNHNCSRGDKWSYQYVYQGIPFLKLGLCHCCKCN